SKELRWTGDQVESLRSGGWDPVARLADMDMDGIAAEVLYPSVGMTLAQSTDVDYQLACIRAYNDWLVEYCEAGRGRLVGLAMIPTVDVDAGVTEVDRTADDGLRGAMVAGMPAYRLDQMYERHHNWLGRNAAPIRRQPSEYLRDNCWFTFQKDPVAVETRERVGIGQLMWASDYPHSDSTWPHSRKVIERDFAGV